MLDSDAHAGEKGIPAPGMLIVTGGSHAGKTTLAKAILAQLDGEAAYLGLDDVLHGALPAFPGDVWTEIPLAYELIEAQAELLLDRGWFVIVESTFTFVAADGGAEFHAAALNRLTEIATSHAAPVLIAQVVASPNVTARRARESGRLPPSVVSATVALHAEASLPPDAIAIDCGHQGPSEAAATVVSALKARTG